MNPNLEIVLQMLELYSMIYSASKVKNCIKASKMRI